MKGVAVFAQHIAFYGKGGVGTSTTATNISVALAEAGQRVIQVGFDPERDSTGVLRGDRKIRTILDVVQKSGDAATDDFIVRGFKGVLCMETGLPSPDLACTGHDALGVIQFLKERSYLEKYNPDIVIYDVSGEAVCGGIAGSLLNDIAERIFIVSSADFKSFYTANNFFRNISRHAASGARLGGIIANGLTSPFAETIMADFALKTGTRIAGTIPRSLVVMQSALYNQSVIEAAPLSNHAYIYRRLARQIVEEHETFRPRPLSPEGLKSWARDWGDMILELETGIIGRGGGI
jgi:nitrogenase iron protein NifH